MTAYVMTLKHATKETRCAMCAADIPKHTPYYRVSCGDDLCTECVGFLASKELSTPDSGTH